MFIVNKEPSNCSYFINKALIRNKNFFSVFQKKKYIIVSKWFSF